MREVNNGGRLSVDAWQNTANIKKRRVQKKSVRKYEEMCGESLNGRM